MNIAPAALFAGFCAVAFSQSYDTFPAKISGTSGDRGKCTIEVMVDGTTEVEIKGSEGRMRTLSGARAAWRRLDCNMPLPPNPAGFRFTAAKNRGTQTLLHEPGKNQGVAVVRIEDPDTGSKSYKFELVWNGVAGGFEQGGLANGGLTESGSRQGGLIDDATLAGWTDRIEFRGHGDGYYQSYRGSDDLLSDAEVVIERSGHVEIRLMSKGKAPMMLTGRLVKADGTHLIANVAGGSISGSMEIVRDNRNHIKSLSMTGEGRAKSELRWRSEK